MTKPRIRFVADHGLSDRTHSLAGQSVPMVDLPTWAASQSSMICALCAGRHHAMACAQGASTLRAIGVAPWLLQQGGPVVEIVEARPWFAVKPGARSLVDNVLAASGHTLQLNQARESRHLRAVDPLAETG